MARSSVEAATTRKGSRTHVISNVAAGSARTQAKATSNTKKTEQAKAGTTSTKASAQGKASSSGSNTANRLEGLARSKSSSADAKKKGGGGTIAARIAEKMKARKGIKSY